MKQQKTYLLILSLLACVAMNAQEYPGLKDLIGKDFYIGVAMNPRQLEGAESAFIVKNFTTATAENIMKPAALLRQEGGYNWEPADQMVEFARKNGMKMRGHTLVWHASTPRWYVQNAEGKPISKEELFTKHETYIKDVMEHFPSDVVFCWDVVNEALADEPGGSIYRTNSPWYTIWGGPEYIEWAFRTARKYAPKNVKLYYNDYNLVDPAKLERAYTMLKGLVESGVPIDGVGLQAHWDNTVTAEMIQNAIDKFSSLGLDIQITELDLTIYDNYHGTGAAERQKAKTTLPYSPEISKAQADEYETIFSVLHKNHKKISSVTFWCLSDRTSWLNSFPIRGRKDYPLLFDDNMQPKEAFMRLIKIYKPKLYKNY